MFKIRSFYYRLVVTSLQEIRELHLNTIHTQSEKIERRVSRFINETNTRKGVQTVLITTLGCEKNRNTDVCQRFLTLDDLFI